MGQHEDRRCGLLFTCLVSHLPAAMTRLIRGRTEQSFRRRARTISKPDASTAALAQGRAHDRGLTSSLDDTEQSILREIVAGSSLRQIALKLGLQLSQVETLRATLMEKLHASSTADLVRIGIYAEH